MLPSLLAGGAEASRSGFPLAARADLLWPSEVAARSNDQYVWLNDTLVAPIFDSTANTSSRDVYFPPGEWHDAWNGTIVKGPCTLAVSQPYERIPLYHRSGGRISTHRRSNPARSLLARLCSAPLPLSPLEVQRFEST